MILVICGIQVVYRVLKRCNLTRPTGSYVSTDWVVIADVTLDHIGGVGVNHCNPRYSVFNEAALPPLVVNSFPGDSVTLDTTSSVLGKGSIKVVKVATSSYVHLILNPTYSWTNLDSDYNITISPNRKWILSFYIKSSIVSPVIYAHMMTKINPHVGVSVVTPILVDTWGRCSCVIDLTNNASARCCILFNIFTAIDHTINIDGIMLEAMVGNNTNPSPFVAPTNFLEVYQGALDADKTSTVDVAAQINNNTTTIHGGKITTGTINALGSVTVGAFNINNKFIMDTSGNTTIQSATSGERTVILNNVIKVYDTSGVLRVKLGDLSA